MKAKFLIIITAGIFIMTGCTQKKLAEPSFGRMDKTPYEIKECLNELGSGKDIKMDKIDKIVVNKSQKKLLAYKSGKVVNEFPISLGKNWNKGTKMEIGDYRTPEGTYKIVRKKCDDRLYRNLLISYPNSADIARCKAIGKNPGNLITIHGQPKWNANGIGDAYTLKHDWTEGCVAVPNAGMKFLWEAIALGAIVEIHP
jgi:murein L,D-transpeptidase YafK